MRHWGLALLLVASPCLAQETQAPDSVRAALAAWGWEGEWAQRCGAPENGVVVARVPGTGSEYPATALLRDGRMLALSITRAAELTAAHELWARADTAMPYGVLVTDALLHREGQLSWAVESRVRLTASAVVAPRTQPYAPAGLQPGESVTMLVIEHALLRNPDGGVRGPAPVYELCGAVTAEERRLIEAARTRQ